MFIYILKGIYLRDHVNIYFFKVTSRLRKPKVENPMT
ncbi:hypothetical protein LRU_01971 [Ligilactobacillus ruminis SPM0211]|uniref:Uncharacterized protein n=1 Tax=Ligilactobacillus ruminis SPM0211 TaxID=1040964 RepID=F7R2N5_9LACO|nr:hypothetical protein LRU_01971 [Ligilactobacillus ruminis SPM0211]